MDEVRVELMSPKEFSAEYKIPYHHVLDGIARYEIDVRDRKRHRKDIVLSEKTLQWARDFHVEPFTMKKLSAETGIRHSVIWKAVMRGSIDYHYFRSYVEIDKTQKTMDWVKNIKQNGIRLNNAKKVKIIEKHAGEIREYKFMSIGEASIFIGLSRMVLDGLFKQKGSGFVRS